MKLRSSFVTNSSSTCFTITNKTNMDKTLIDFVNENPDLVEWFNGDYGYDFTQEDMLKDAKSRDQIFPANSSISADYGDEDGDVLGHVFDYILRDGGESESFRWRFKEYWR